MTYTARKCLHMNEETRFAFIELKLTTVLEEINLFPC